MGRVSKNFEVMFKISQEHIQEDPEKDYPHPPPSGPALCHSVPWGHSTSVCSFYTSIHTAGQLLQTLAKPGYLREAIHTPQTKLGVSVTRASEHNNMYHSRY